MFDTLSRELKAVVAVAIVVMLVIAGAAVYNQTQQKPQEKDPEPVRDYGYSLSYVDKGVTEGVRYIECTMKMVDLHRTPEGTSEDFWKLSSTTVYLPLDVYIGHVYLYWSDVHGSYGAHWYKSTATLDVWFTFTLKLPDEPDVKWSVGTPFAKGCVFTQVE